MLARALARSLSCTFRRIQFTPDLLPSDVTGLSIYNQKSQEFEFRPGPIVSQVVLADEINRATPKTQSALLEAMEERHMTVDGVTRPLPRPFMVIATQNPIEYEGTFPLPEAQLDRFMLRLRMGYPEPMDEMLILDEQKRGHPVETLEPVADADEVLAMQQAVREIYVDPAISDYIVRLVSASRTHPDVYLGASPARLAGAVPRQPGLGGHVRPGLRHPRRRQGAGRAGPGPPHHRQDGRLHPRPGRPRRGQRDAHERARSGRLGRARTGQGVRRA